MERIVLSADQRAAVLYRMMTPQNTPLVLQVERGADVLEHYYGRVLDVVLEYLNEGAPEKQPELFA